jgi:hypothetical protein
MEAFRRTSQGVAARIELSERAVLSELLRQFIELMSRESLGCVPWLNDESSDPLSRLERQLGESAAKAAPLGDPALRRLFPDAYSDDEAASAEYARLTRVDLRDAKVSAALKMGEDLVSVDKRGRLHITYENTLNWMTTLTNLRLVMAERAHIAELGDEFAQEIDEGDPNYAVWSLYNWLGWVQETLVTCML